MIKLPAHPQLRRAAGASAALVLTVMAIAGCGGTTSRSATTGGRAATQPQTTPTSASTTPTRAHRARRAAPRASGSGQAPRSNAAGATPSPGVSHDVPIAALTHLADLCRALPPAGGYHGLPNSPSASQLRQVAETLLPRASALSNVLMTGLTGPPGQRLLARLAPLQASVTALRFELTDTLASPSAMSASRLQTTIQTAGSRALTAGLPQCSPATTAP